MKLDIKFDAETLSSIEALGRYPEFLEPALKLGMGYGINEISLNVAKVTDNRFKSDNERFLDSTHSSVDSPYQAQFWSEAPYAQRLEYGFSGLTDALGRYYPEWPAGRYAATGYRWATRAAELSKKSIEIAFRLYIEQAHTALGRSMP
jgi:hypothetical protein